MIFYSKKEITEELKPKSPTLSQHHYLNSSVGTAHVVTTDFNPLEGQKDISDLGGFKNLQGLRCLFAILFDVDFEEAGPQKLTL